MTDIFAVNPQSQDGLFVHFFQGVEQQTRDGATWVAYFTHPVIKKTTRIEIRQDLLAHWSASRYTSVNITRRSFPQLELTCKLVFRWVKHLEHKGMLRTIETGDEIESAFIKPQSAVNTTQIDDIEPVWVQGLLTAFTLHNDWVDLATCLSLSADEYVDANWRRFRDWLEVIRQCKHTDREVFAFGMAVWRAYRQDVVV